MSKTQLSLTETSDFHCLLELMMPLYEIEEYSWLPELFSVIGHDSLILLCKYAGGSTIKIPTLDEVSEAIEALQWYYDTHLLHKKKKTEIPVRYRNMVAKIAEVMNASNDTEVNS